MENKVTIHDTNKPNAPQSLAKPVSMRLKIAATEESTFYMKFNTDECASRILESYVSKSLYRWTVVIGREDGRFEVFRFAGNTTRYRFEKGGYEVFGTIIGKAIFTTL